jgi:hypothetical protein
MGLQALAQEVACYLGLDLSSIKIKRFADGEIYVQVQVRLPTLSLTWEPPAPSATLGNLLLVHCPRGG